MRIALPTGEGDDEMTTVSGHFGQTAGFTVVDTEKDETEFVPHTGGRGPNASPPPETIIEADADVVVAGGIGRGAVSRLRNEAITVYCGAEGTVADALERWRDNELTEVEPGDVHGHSDDHGHDHQQKGGHEHGHGDCHCNCGDGGHGAGNHQHGDGESPVPPFDR